MIIEPGTGLGPLKFGVSPKDVVILMGEEQTWEHWMGGNLNDSLLYPGMIISFDKYDSKEPLEDSRVIEFRLNRNTGDVQFFGLSVFEVDARQIEVILTNEGIPFEYNDAYMSIRSIGLEFCIDADGKVCEISLWKT